MNVQNRVIVGVALFMLLLFSCSAYRQANELKQNQSLWMEQKASSYKYTFRHGCFCSPETTDPVFIEVRNGEQISITRPTKTTLKPQGFEQYGTIEKLFELVQSTINSNPYELTVEYNRQYGYPSRISINPNKNVADDEDSYTVSNFQVIQLSGAEKS